MCLVLPITSACAATASRSAQTTSHAVLCDLLYRPSILCEARQSKLLSLVRLTGKGSPEGEA